MIASTDLRPLPPFGIGIEVEASSDTGRVLGELLMERGRQLTELGYSAAHDDGHDMGELARAAASHSLSAASWQFPEGNQYREVMRGRAAEAWPFDRQATSLKTARQHLVIAGALIIAEIERLDRLAGGAA